MTALKRTRSGAARDKIIRTGLAEAETTVAARGRITSLNPKPRRTRRRTADNRLVDSRVLASGGRDGRIGIDGDGADVTGWIERLSRYPDAAVLALALRRTPAAERPYVSARLAANRRAPATHHRRTVSAAGS